MQPSKESSCGVLPGWKIIQLNDGPHRIPAVARGFEEQRVALEPTLVFGEDEQRNCGKYEHRQHDPKDWMCLFWGPYLVTTSFSDHGTKL
ncbi:hypothetical protein CH305_05270 [Rhodococcus sp. 15-649-2-2]|nr:hypothetical protein CH305_05270 [Rhodococcus sp. 15-649-2-2]